MHRSTWTAITVLLITVVAGCTSREDPASVSAGRREVHDAMVAYTVCMRARGIDIADPYIDDHGGWSTGGFTNGDRREFDAASAECATRHLPVSDDPSSEEPVAHLLALNESFRRCLREDGIVAPAPNHRLAVDDERVATAVRRCEEAIGEPRVGGSDGRESRDHDGQHQVGDDHGEHDHEHHDHNHEDPDH